jgi:hypothetical protein
MNTSTHTNGIGRSIRLGVAATLATMATVGAAAFVSATPAFAAITPLVNARLAQGNASDFSYTSTGQQMARNVNVDAFIIESNTTARYAWRDQTAGGPWNQGPSVVATVANDAGATITAIPASTCGHTLQVSVTGEEWQGNGYATVTGYATVGENCGPIVVWNSSNGFFGDGFSAGGSVLVYVQNQNYSVISSSIVMATLERFVPGICVPVGVLPHVHLVCEPPWLLTPPGDINVTNLPVPTTCGVTYSYTLYDLVSGDRTSTTMGYSCIN